MGFNQKIKLIIKKSGLTYIKFSEFTGISLSSLKKYSSENREPSFTSVVKILDKYPQYALWLTIDEVVPEAGQVSPEQEAPQMASAGVPEKLLNDAFFQTMNTAIALSWLTPKKDLEFSMLSDLHRHNFVEAGGVLFAQDPAQGESKTA